MMVEPRSPSKGPIEIDLDLQVQDDKRIARLTKKLVEVTVDDEEPTKVLKIGRNLEQDRFDELV